MGGLDAGKREQLRAILRSRDAVVADAVACEPYDNLSWSELLACGDAAAGGGERAKARARYHAAFLVAPDRNTQFGSLLRIEELGYDVTDELMMLPRDRAAQYPVWRSMVGAPRRRAGFVH
jgi:hypothetical protein